MLTLFDFFWIQNGRKWKILKLGLNFEINIYKTTKKWRECSFLRSFKSLLRQMLVISFALWYICIFKLFKLVFLLEMPWMQWKEEFGSILKTKHIKITPITSIFVFAISVLFEFSTNGLKLLHPAVVKQHSEITFSVFFWNNKSTINYFFYSKNLKFHRKYLWKKNINKYTNH